MTGSVLEELLGKLGRERVDFEFIVVVKVEPAHHFEMKHVFVVVVSGFESQATVPCNEESQ